ncbi:MAG TPA: glycosyltransferase family 2 protein [Candidatus Microsaccharimonas sp.]|nr:glycosyltransferase family 2 protein [Candidatus Microsaccharimonas sp.]
MTIKRPILSVVVPLYNEAAGIETFYQALHGVLEALQIEYEIIFCNDGSRDDTLAIIRRLAKQDRAVRYLSLTRNFGKELAVTAGIHAARGKAILMLDADGQHPVKRIPEFIEHWRAGAKVVVGIRTANRHQALIKKLGSSTFYRLFNKLSHTRLVPGSTDFRLIDETVQHDFIRLTERNRITRGLIDWLGYKQEYIYFEANDRIAGEATYSLGGLLKLSIDSVVSLSVSPLFVVAYIGAVVLPLSLLIGLGMVVNLLFGDPLGLHATGGAYVAVLTLCLVGILMVSQGVIGLYLSHIHAESQNRPLYLIDRDNSSDKL